jgi:uncharacterized membrane protein YphA (DoxX/SURF4 family)
MKKFFNPTLQPWLTLLARLILGGVLLAAGWIKAMKPSEAAASVRVYEVLPVNIANTFGYILPWVEIGIALLLIIGIWSRWTSVAAGTLMFLFVIAITQAWARKLPINCGCFGNGGITADGKVHPWTYATEIIRDLGLILLSIFITYFPGGKFALDTGNENHENGGER